MYRELLKRAVVLYVQKYGGLAYALTDEGLQVSTPLVIVYKRYYQLDKLRVTFIDGLAVEGEVIPYDTFFVMKDYVIYSY